MVLRPLCGPGRAARPRAAPPRERRGARARLRRCVHRPPARSTSSRTCRVTSGSGVYLPLEDPPPLRRHRARRAERGADALAPLRGGTRPWPPGRRAAPPGTDRWASGAGGRAVRPGGLVAWTGSRNAGRASSRSARSSSRSASRGRRSEVRNEEADAEVERVMRERARNFAYGNMGSEGEAPRDPAIYAFAREVDDMADGDAPPDEKRAGCEELDRPPRRARERRRDVESRWADARDASRSRRRRSTTRRRRPDGSRPAAAWDTFDELRATARHVAGAIGVACIGCTTPTSRTRRDARRASRCS